MISPDLITILGLLFAVVGFYFEPPFGFVFFGVSFLMDVIDGRVARRYKLVTKFGGVLDSVFDKVVEVLFLAYITVNYPIGGLGVLAAGFSVIISYVKHRSGLKLKSVFDRAQRMLFLLVAVFLFGDYLISILLLFNALCLVAIIELMIKVKNKFSEVN
ncbi:MAG TPA: CDP-alcohol phosphatidyltransferase family protein [Candidatus Nanoarchaeia archaeon]|nr:CDP-alcohol phosphatidyltransferase family protein [Candidatus Nanoarchaeia archaeon]